VVSSTSVSFIKIYRENSIQKTQDFILIGSFITNLWLHKLHPMVDTKESLKRINISKIQRNLLNVAGPDQHIDFSHDTNRV
jgi:hypothetical protein